MFMNEKVNKFFSYQSKHKSKDVEAELEKVQKQLCKDNYDTYQRSFCSQLVHPNKSLLYFGRDFAFAPIYAIYLYEIGDSDLTGTKLNMIKIFEEQIIGKYPKLGINLVVFTRAVSETRHNQYTEGIKVDAYKQKVLKTLQVKYLKLIKNIYVCHEGFIAKSLRNFSLSRLKVHTQVIDLLIRNCDKLSPLVAQLGPLFECELIPEGVQRLQESSDWFFVFNEQDKKIAERRLRSFMGDSGKQLKFYKKSLKEYKHEVGAFLPIILNCLLSTISDKHSQVEGIFRTAANVSKLTEFQKRIASSDTYEFQSIIGRQSPETLAACVKNILNSLDPPLFSYQLYEVLKQMLQNNTEEQIQSSPNTENSHQDIQVSIQIEVESVKGLPNNITQIIRYLSIEIDESSRKVLKSLLQFINHHIVSKQHINRMSSYNMSVILGPCLFRPQQYSVSDLLFAPQIIRILSCLIDNPSLLTEYSQSQSFNNYHDQWQDLQSRDTEIGNDHDEGLMEDS